MAYLRLRWALSMVYPKLRRGACHGLPENEIGSLPWITRNWVGELAMAHGLSLTKMGAMAYPNFRWLACHAWLTLTQMGSLPWLTQNSDEELTMAYPKIRRGAYHGLVQTQIRSLPWLIPNSEWWVMTALALLDSYSICTDFRLRLHVFHPKFMFGS